MGKVSCVNNSSFEIYIEQSGQLILELNSPKKFSSNIGWNALPYDLHNCSFKELTKLIKKSFASCCLNPLN